jgi:hypothetical protein
MAEFKFSCPQCGQNIQCGIGYSGTKINCPSCKQFIVVPQPPSVSQPANSKRTKAKWPMIITGVAVLLVIIAGLFLFWFFAKPSGLIGMWSGNGNGHNSVGGNNALLTDIVFAKGKTGQAFLFNSENAEIKIPASKEFRVGLTNGFTLAAWINPTDVSKDRPIFEWNAGNGTTYWGVHFHIAPGQPTTGSSGPAGPGQLYANIVDRNGRWHQLGTSAGVVASNVFQYVALTYDRKSGDAKIYCNGDVVSKQDVGHFAPQTGYNLYLGKRPLTQGDTDVFAGLLENAAVYNRALSEDEIQKIYTEQK